MNLRSLSILLVCWTCIAQQSPPPPTISAPKLPEYAQWLHDPGVPPGLRHQLIPLYITLDQNLRFLNDNKWENLQNVLAGLWSAKAVLRSSAARTVAESAGEYKPYPMATNAASKPVSHDLTDRLASAIVEADQTAKQIWEIRRKAGWEATIGPEPKKLTREYLLSPESMMKFLERSSSAASSLQVVTVSETELLEEETKKNFLRIEVLNKEAEQALQRNFSCSMACPADDRFNDCINRCNAIMNAVCEPNFKEVNKLFERNLKISERQFEISQGRNQPH